MSYCNQTLAGITLDCTNNMGGIKTVYIANFGDVESWEVDTENTPEEGQTIDPTFGCITGMTMASGATFKPYQFRKGTSNMTSTLTADETNGLNYVTTEVSLVFTRMDTPKRIELSALSIGQLAVIVLDSNGKYWYVTPDDYAAASAGGAETGTAKGDRNAFTLTLSAENTTYPIEMTEDAVKSVIAK